MWTASARHQYRRSGRYATDVTDAEFARIEPLLPAARHGGRRRTTVLREVLNALLYLLRTGCPWRMLPHQFPPRSTVYGYFRRFWQDGVWTMIQATLLMAAREQAGREGSPSAAIIDSQSVKTIDSKAVDPVPQAIGPSRRAGRRGGWPARLRRRQENQRPRATSAHRHAGFAAAPGRPSRQHPGPRWPGVRLRPDSPALPLATAPVW